MDSRPDAAEEMHQIHGTDRSFSSKPEDLDEKAAEALREILEKGIDEMKVHDDPFGMDPQQLPKGFFLAKGRPFCQNMVRNTQVQDKKNAIWRSHDSSFGYGIGHHASGYRSYKKTYAYHKGNCKTNCIMNVYFLINEYGDIKFGDVVLCHVFQSENYDPRPNPFPKSLLPNSFDFHHKKEVHSRMEQLEGLMKNPESFKDFYEFEFKIDSKSRANGKRAEVWEHFTPIKVLGPNGEVMLTLAICHYCNMAYLTGKWDSKKGIFSNNGTKTLNNHYSKCSDQHHIAGNPQGAHH